MRAAIGAALLLVAIVLAVAAAAFALLWASQLEADYVNVGTVLGRDTAEPRVSTLTVAAVAAIGAAAAYVGARRLRRGR